MHTPNHSARWTKVTGTGLAADGVTLHRVTLQSVSRAAVPTVAFGASISRFSTGYGGTLSLYAPARVTDFAEVSYTYTGFFPGTPPYVVDTRQPRTQHLTQY